VPATARCPSSSSSSRGRRSTSSSGSCGGESWGAAAPAAATGARGPSRARLRWARSRSAALSGSPSRARYCPSSA
jgi:hypothetical protein